MRIKDLEEDSANYSGEDVIMASIAISLKRIADAITNPKVAPQCACGGPCHRCAGKCKCQTCSHGAA